MGKQHIASILRIAAGCAMSTAGITLAVCSAAIALPMAHPVALRLSPLLGHGAPHRPLSTTMLLALSAMLLLTGLRIAAGWPRSHTPRCWATAIWAVSALGMLAVGALSIRGITIERSVATRATLDGLDSLRRHVFLTASPSTPAHGYALSPHLRIGRCEGSRPELEVVKSAHGSTRLGARVHATRIPFGYHVFDTTLRIDLMLAPPSDAPWHQYDVALLLLLPAGHSLRIDPVLEPTLEPLQPLCPKRWPSEMVGRQLLMTHNELIDNQHTKK